MLKTLVPIFSLLITCSAFAQRPYWQQRVEYKMEIDFDDKKHQFTGRQQLTYYNNSPDTLRKVFYHLYFNAFQPGSNMDVRSNSIPDGYMNRITTVISSLKPKDQGFHNILSLTQDGNVCVYNTVGTILEVDLATPILPGGKTVFSMEFFSQVPKLLERTGKFNMEGVDYSMAQWYPKLCVYDDQGWHADPYVGREFYGEFGDFDVKITIDKKFMLGGTGYLQNAQEIGKGYEDPSLPLDLSQEKRLTWHFFAPNVHDFMWAADPTYVHEKRQVNDSLMLHFIWLKTADKYHWQLLQNNMVKMFDEMSVRFGTYPYKQFSCIQGGDGGMEYPMATLIMDDGEFYDLLGVAVHETIHNWYYGVLGNNESKYPFMDEGFTTWASYQMEDFLYGNTQYTSVFDAYNDYRSLVNSSYYEPLTTHSDFYKTAFAYEYSAYYVGVVFVDELIYIIGKNAFDKGMKQYFEEWKFRHPRPADFIRVMEKASGLELDWYLEQFTGTVNKVDYMIDHVVRDGNNTNITLKKTGKFPMPLDIAVDMRNGDRFIYHIPLDLMRGAKPNDYPSGTKYEVLQDWSWVNPEYTFSIPLPYTEISTIIIDPTGRLIDINPDDNTKSFE